MTRSELQDLARQVAVSNGLPPEGFVAQIGQESSWNPNAVSPVGAMGLAQFMPATWAEAANQRLQVMKKPVRPAKLRALLRHLLQS